MAIRTKGAGLYVCGNCKHRCVFVYNVGWCCKYDERQEVKTRKTASALKCEHFAFIRDEQKQEMMKGIY